MRSGLQTQMGQECNLFSGWKTAQGTPAHGMHANYLILYPQRFETAQIGLRSSCLIHFDGQPKREEKVSRWSLFVIISHPSYCVPSRNEPSYICNPSNQFIRVQGP